MTVRFLAQVPRRMDLPSAEEWKLWSRCVVEDYHFHFGHFVLEMFSKIAKWRYQVSSWVKKFEIPETGQGWRSKYLHMKGI